VRRALAAAALLVLPFAALPAPAQATVTASVVQLPKSVYLHDPPGLENDRMSVAVTYRCFDDEEGPGDWYLYGGVDRFQYGQRYVGWQTAKCYGSEVTEVLSFRRVGMDTDPPPVVAGPADLTVGLFFAPGAPEGGASQTVERTVTTNIVLPTDAPPPPPPPAKASIKVTANAAPEPVTKGKTITVTGKLVRNGKAYASKNVDLQFRTPTGKYAKVKTVRSSTAGNLKTTVKATRDGCFRYAFAGNSTTKSGASAGDCIDVKAPPKPLPKPKDYANCAALNKVYPHGVGRTGAVDAGGEVTKFTRDNATYALNTESDRDKDKIACEK